MPETYQVRVLNVDPTAKQGAYDAIEITGYNLTKAMGFKKKFFAKLKNGGPTKAATAAYTLAKDDWCSITLDDTEYNNVMSIVKIPPPVGAESAPAAGGGGGGGSAPRTSVAAPADPDKQNRQTRGAALRAAVEFMAIMGKTKGHDNVKLTLDVARKFYDYLNTPDREPGYEQPAGPEVTPHGNIIHHAPADEPAPAGPVDDDIPF